MSPKTTPRHASAAGAQACVVGARAAVPIFAATAIAAVHWSPMKHSPDMAGRKPRTTPRSRHSVTLASSPHAKTLPRSADEALTANCIGRIRLSMNQSAKRAGQDPFTPRHRSPYSAKWLANKNDLKLRVALLPKPRNRYHFCLCIGLS